MQRYMCISNNELITNLDCKLVNFDERYKDEELHNYIKNTLNSIENCDGFIIPCALGNDMTYNSYIGLRLAIHMRLTHSSEFQYWNKPIIFTSFDLIIILEGPCCSLFGILRDPWAYLFE